MASDSLNQAEIVTTEKKQPSGANFFLTQVKNGIWLVGIPSWLFGMSDRGLAALTDGYLSAVELFQILMASFLFVSWLSLKPTAQTDEDEDGVIPDQMPFKFSPASVDLEAAQRRMTELENYHLISQAYILPYPYLCQIYHLLNLKHLETIHSFSLNNLKVVKVNHLEQTDRGGVIKFQTILDSPWNVLRIWRKPVVEAQLTLHTPYTVELMIPVYGDKAIIVIFNTIPLGHAEHQFCVDIYSNLPWYKPLLKLLLHTASILTLIEDLPYLRALMRTGSQRLVNPDKTISHEMMWLFGRFVSLYGAQVSSAQVSSTSKLTLPEAKCEVLPEAN